MPDNPPATDGGSVTTVIVQRPLKAHVAEYEAWLKEIMPVAQTFSGHRGVNVIRPHGQGDGYTIVLHFDTEAHLCAWLESDVRKRLVEKVRPYLHADEIIDVKPGIEFWFTPPDNRKAAPAYKQFLVTLSAIFPLTVIVPWLLAPVFEHVPALAANGVRQLFVDTVIVALMIFLIMPRYVKLVSKWLYR